MGLVVSKASKQAYEARSHFSHSSHQASTKCVFVLAGFEACERGEEKRRRSKMQNDDDDDVHDNEQRTQLSNLANEEKGMKQS